MTTPPTDNEKLHYNGPQLLYYLVQAAINVIIWGRATGKTEGPMAIGSVENIHKMPRSNGFLMGTTYEQLLTRTLPPLIAGWEKLGYYENIHYFVRKFAPEKYKWPKAYRHPLKAEHYIHWYNGSGIYLVSQDRPGTINGVRTQWGAGDEAKLLNYEKMVAEVLPTMAGHADKFGHLSNYLSLLFCSDMPTTSKGKWLLDYKQQMDPAVIEAILHVQVQIAELQQLLLDAGEATKKKLSSRMNELLQYLNELRKDTVYCSYASTLDNIHALGLQPLKQFKRTMNDLAFQIAILNKQIVAVENGFYGLLDEDEHGYDHFDYQHIDTLPLSLRGAVEKDCRWDADILPLEPLDISCDYNNKINCVVVGQERMDPWEYWFLHSMYVLDGELIRGAVNKFNNYFKYHRNKTINFYYDHTAIAGSASTDISYADEWKDRLTALGWNVISHYMGQASSHHSRYLLWGMVLKGGDARLPAFRYNRTNCQAWANAAKQAAVIQKGQVFVKDKNPEKDPNVPAQDATHLTEAGDGLIYGKFRAKVGEVTDFFDTLVI